MLDARSFMISTLRSQVGFAAAVAHARLRLSCLELIGGSGRTAGRYASAAPAFISPTAPSSRCGEALWERVEAESGSLGAASSESAAGSGRPRACGCSVGRGFGFGRRADVRVVCWWVWMVVTCEVRLCDF